MCRLGNISLFLAAILCLVSSHPLLSDSTSNDCGDSTSCLAGQTCCKSETGYGCCDGVDAVCCIDGLHCCPRGSTCDLVDNTCKLMAVKRTNNIKATTILAAAKKGPIKLPSESANNICPIIAGDPHRYECPSFNTCCIRSDGKYGCCPHKNAVCCADGIHCCPENKICGPGGTCQRQNDLLFKVASAKRL